MWQLVWRMFISVSATFVFQFVLLGTHSFRLGSHSVLRAVEFLLLLIETVLLDTQCVLLGTNSLLLGSHSALRAAECLLLRIEVVVFGI